MTASRLFCSAFAVAAIVACDRAKNAQPGGAEVGPSGTAVAATGASSSGVREDPCTLVSRAEAEKYLGPLAHDPYLVNDSGEPSPGGSKCEYLGGDGQHIYIDPTWSGGKIVMQTTSIAGQAVGTIFTENTGKTDTLEGVWDESRWLGPGTFFGLKDDAMVITDVSSTLAGITAAADLNSKALGRIAKPLAYDGGKAAGDAPHPRATGDACALLTRGDVEAIVGTLDAAPTSTGKDAETQCIYRVRANGAPAEIRLAVTWRDGFEHFAAQKMAAGTVQQQGAGLTAAHGQTGAGVKGEAMKPSMSNDPDAQKLFGALKGLAQKNGIQMDNSLALVHDTAVAGPWTEGAILSGVTLVAVKHDVLVSVDFRALSIDKAKALVAKTMERL